MLEVVAKAEVAQHLEERVVPRGDADVFDVVGADAALGGGGARDGPAVGARGLAQEYGLELEHACDGQQHRRVLRDQGGGRELGVPLGFVK